MEVRVQRKYKRSRGLSSPHMMDISFKALQLANEQRNAYGLRYNDFARYRKHCGNRTHRLRSTLKITHGKGKDFKKSPTVTTENLKDGHLQLLLFEAERAWAYAQELSALALLPANEDKASSLRHSATGRFRRAVSWSAQMLSQCQALFAISRISAEHLLQATIYTLVLNGRFLRFRDEFDVALIQLGVARGLLDALAANASTSRDQALATLFADEIGPEIRYCAHELGRAKAYDVDGIVAEVSSKNRDKFVDGCDALVEGLKSGANKGEGKKRLETLMWEGQPVPVRVPELVDVLLKVQEAEGRLGGKQAQGSKKSVAAYDAILLALSDAEDVARKLTEAHQLASTSSGAGTRDIQFVHSYIIYQLLSKRIERDRLLISALLSSNTKTSKSMDARLFPAVIKLLDTVLQSLDQMRALSVVDDSTDLASAVEARISFTKAQRCIYLARSYTPTKRYAEALVLAQHANIHLRETRSTMSLFDEDPTTFYSLTTAEVDALDASLASEVLRFKKEWFAYNGGTVGGDSSTHKKPVFFDIALNYVPDPTYRLRVRAGLEEEMDSEEDEETAEPEVVAAAPPKVAKAARVEEEMRAATPEPRIAASKSGGLTNLLGGWWGKS